MVLYYSTDVQGATMSQQASKGREEEDCKLVYTYVNSARLKILKKISAATEKRNTFKASVRPQRHAKHI